MQTGLVEGTNTENVANHGTRCRPMKLPLHDPAFLDLTSILPTPLVMSACCVSDTCTYETTDTNAEYDEPIGYASNDGAYVERHR